MKITPYPRNAKKHPTSQLMQIAKSIQEFGWQNDILVDREGVIIAGHGRFMAFEKFGTEFDLPKPKIRVASELNAKQVKAYRLADNKLAESDYDMDLVIEELKELDDHLIDLTGFDVDLIIEPDDKDDDVPDVPEEPNAKLGDIYQLGQHRIMCGDSTKVEDVERLMNGKKADMVFTDPPYGIDIVGKNGKVGAGKLAKNQVYSEVIGDDTTDTAKAFYDTCVSLGFEAYILWGGNYFLSFLPFSASWIVWDKRGDMNSNNFADGEMAWTNVKTRVRIYKQIWKGMIREGEKEKRVHPTQKPIMTLENILKDFTKEKKLIYDGFLGSGSTLIACEKTNRICHGCELDPKYIDVIIQRWENYTGNKAVKI